MKSVLIVIVENCVVAHVTDTIRFFNRANEQLKARGSADLFKVETVGFSESLLMQEPGLTFSVNKTIQAAGKPELIIVPSFTGDVVSATQLNRHYYGWLTKHYKTGACIVSFAKSVFLLAAAGLLHNKACALDQDYHAEFVHDYQQVKYDTENVITECNGIYTCGRESFYWQLLLNVLCKYTDKQLILQLANHFHIGNRIKTEPSPVVPENEEEDDNMDM